jgi:rhodanese-related sulfurtransferase
MVMPEFHALVNEAKKEIKEITPAELKNMQGEVTVIDVREREDNAKGAIPGALNIPRGMLEHSIDQVTTEKDKTLVLYCGGGSRSALAAASLKKGLQKRDLPGRRL